MSELDTIDSGTTSLSKATYLVVTDLDATLLDHRYSWKAAESAILALQSRGFPLVLNSSKTLPEMKALAEELQLHSPIVAENGSIIAFPQDMPDLPAAYADLPIEMGYHVKYLGTPRQEIVELAIQLRRANGYNFSGFADWTASDVAERTGLSEPAAGLALQRLGTEPIVWNDTEENWTQFEDALAVHKIRAIRGGRFIHLMGQCDKAGGLQAAANYYKAGQPDANWQVVALGDSANDVGMMSAADVAVVIPNDHHNDFLEPTAPRVIRPTNFGPTGWNEAIQQILTEND